MGHRHTEVEHAEIFWLLRSSRLVISGALIGLLPFKALDLGHDASKIWYNFQAQTRAFFVLNAIHQNLNK